MDGSEIGRDKHLKVRNLKDGVKQEKINKKKKWIILLEFKRCSYTPETYYTDMKSIVERH